MSTGTDFFSGITEDYSNYKWYKGEAENPYLNDEERPLAARFWEYERDFHIRYLDQCDTSVSLAEAYNRWKMEFLCEHLSGNSANPFGDTTDWDEIFETGRR